MRKGQPHKQHSVPLGFYLPVHQERKVCQPLCVVHACPLPCGTGVGALRHLHLTTWHRRILIPKKEKRPQKEKKGSAVVLPLRFFRFRRPPRDGKHVDAGPRLRVVQGRQRWDERVCGPGTVGSMSVCPIRPQPNKLGIGSAVEFTLLIRSCTQSASKDEAFSWIATDPPHCTLFALQLAPPGIAWCRVAE